jgi:hypothetical protein
MCHHRAEVWRTQKAEAVPDAPDIRKSWHFGIRYQRLGSQETGSNQMLWKTDSVSFWRSWKCMSDPPFGNYPLMHWYSPKRNLPERHTLHSRHLNAASFPTKSLSARLYLTSGQFLYCVANLISYDRIYSASAPWHSSLHDYTSRIARRAVLNESDHNHMHVFLRKC